MKIWKILSPCLLAGLLLTGCGKSTPMEGLELFARYFGQEEDAVVKACGLDTGWERQERSYVDPLKGEHTLVYYSRTSDGQEDGPSTELGFIEGYGMMAIRYQSGSVPTDWETFYQNSMEMYNWCAERFGEPGLATEQDQAEFDRYLAAIWNPNASYRMPQSEGLYWTEYGNNAETFIQNTYSVNDNLGENGVCSIRTFWWGTGEEFPVTQLEITATCNNPYGEETSASYTVWATRDISDYPEVQ